MRGAIASLKILIRSLIFVCRGRVLYTHAHAYAHAQQYPQVVVERNYTLADSIESH